MHVCLVHKADLFQSVWNKKEMTKVLSETSLGNGLKIWLLGISKLFAEKFFNFKSYVASTISRLILLSIARFVFPLQRKIYTMYVYIYCFRNAIQNYTSKLFNSHLVNSDHFHQRCAKRKLKFCHTNFNHLLASSRLASPTSPVVVSRTAGNLPVSLTA